MSKTSHGSAPLIGKRSMSIATYDKKVVSSDNHVLFTLRPGTILNDVNMKNVVAH